MQAQMEVPILAHFGYTRDPMLLEYETNTEVSRQLFRQFQYTAAAGPREAFTKLWELCCEWLKPKMRSMEQILEMLVLEQFLSILPSNIEAWVRAHGPENQERLFSLIEDLQSQHGNREHKINIDDILLKELSVLESELPANICLDQSILQVEEYVQDPTLIEAKKPQVEPQELNCTAAGESQTILDPGPAIQKPDWNISIEKAGELWIENLMDFQTDGTSCQGPSISKQCGQLDLICEEPPEDLLTAWETCVEFPRPYLGKTIKKERSISGRISKQMAHREKPYHCSQCRRCFLHAKELANHLIIHENLFYVCSTCGKGFIHKSDLCEHKFIHIKERPYECSVCNERFIYEEELITHQKRHFERKHYQCLECSRTFLHRSSFSEHKKTHTGEKSHTCPTCGRKFLRRATLTQHQVTHTSEKPFPCGYCDKRYRHKSSLRIHTKVHTGNIPYRCSCCPKTFLKRYDLVLHLAEHLRKGFPASSS